MQRVFNKRSSIKNQTFILWSPLQTLIFLRIWIMLNIKLEKLKWWAPHQKEFISIRYSIYVLRYAYTDIQHNHKRYYTITVFWWGKYAVLFTFEKLIFSEDDGRCEYQFFKSQLNPIFTETKDSNCFIPYSERRKCI